MVWNMFQFQLLESMTSISIIAMRIGLPQDLLLALCVEIYPADRPHDLIKADVVETLETCSRDCPYTMIRNQEMLLPSHEYVLSLC